MPKIAGTQVAVGLGIESLAAPGVAVAESVYIPWLDFSIQGVSEKAMFKAARGLRNLTSNSMIKRRYSQGQISFVPNVKVMPYFLALAMGGVSSSTVSDAAYTHTFTINNNNATPRTATVTPEQGSIETAQYLNMVCDSLSFEVSDEYAKCTAELIGKFPGTDTISESYANNTEFAYHQYTAKFGATLSAASGASATPLKAFSLTINNNVQIDEAFLSGSNDVVTGGLVMGPLEITGSYTLHFENTTELAKYRANTKNALQVTFTGNLIGSSSLETIQFKIGRLVLTKPPLEYNVDGLVILTQEFTVEYDATDVELTAVVINNVNNLSSSVYNPA